MEHYSILDPGSRGTGSNGHSSQGPGAQSNGSREQSSQDSADIPVPLVQQAGGSPGITSVPMASSSVRPKEHDSESLTGMAERDLSTTLQLLMERAQYITGASAASIALRRDDMMICCARTGQAAPEVGAQLQIDSGLTGESIRTRETLRCDNAETDSRVNQGSCRGLGIVSVMVMPIVQQQEVTGLFELLSSRANAFEERDVIALQRLGEMVQTAVEQADAIKQGVQEIATSELAPPPEEIKVEESKVEEAPPAAEVLSEAAIQVDQPANQPAKVVSFRTCAGCGFPVSEGRKLCLDCEAAEDQNSTSPRAPAWAETRKPKSWLRANIYTIGTVLIVGVTVAVLLLARHF
jgi:putative methionine-R-sulfoxide reductase with GAF domain